MEIAATPNPAASTAAQPSDGGRLPVERESAEPALQNLEELQAPELHEGLGLHYRVIRYLDGRETIEELFRVNGIKDDYEFYEIYTEIALSAGHSHGDQIAIATDGEEAGIDELRIAQGAIAAGLKPVFINLAADEGLIVEALKELRPAGLIFRDAEQREAIRERFAKKESVYSEYLQQMITIEKVYELKDGAANSEPARLVEVLEHRESADVKVKQAETTTKATDEGRSFGVRHNTEVLDISSWSEGLRMPSGSGVQTSQVTGSAVQMPTAVRASSAKTEELSSWRALAEQEQLASRQGVAEPNVAEIFAAISQSEGLESGATIADDIRETLKTEVGEAKGHSLTRTEAKATRVIEAPAHGAAIVIPELRIFEPEQGTAINNPVQAPKDPEPAVLGGDKWTTPTHLPPNVRLQMLAARIKSARGVENAAVPFASIIAEGETIPQGKLIAPSRKLQAA